MKSGNKCFNCGGEHHLSSYPLPKNEDRIKANCKLFMQNKKKDSSWSTSNSTGKKKRSKFSPLTGTEKANNNRRIINRKEQYYLWKAKHWRVVNQAGNGTQADLANNATSVDDSSYTSLADVNQEKKACETLQNLKNCPTDSIRTDLTTRALSVHSKCSPLFIFISWKGYPGYY